LVTLAAGLFVGNHRFMITVQCKELVAGHKCSVLVHTPFHLAFETRFSFFLFFFCLPCKNMCILDCERSRRIYAVSIA
jgi:hypothetical protein